MESRDWLLVVIDSAGNSGLTPIQLQKSLFLIGQSLKLKGFYNFIPYSYGPFDSQIYTDAESLSKEDMVNIIYADKAPYPRYLITSKGSEKVQAMRSDSNIDKIAFAGKTVSFVRNLGFKQLLKIVYENFPDFAINSVFRG